MNQVMLDGLADRLEMGLLARNLRVTVAGGGWSKRVLRLNLVPGPGATVGALERLHRDVALLLGASEGSVKIGQDGRFVTVDVWRGSSKAVCLSPLLARCAGRDPMTAILGVDALGKPVLACLADSNIPHVMIAGTTGSGKSELAKTIIASLALCLPPAEMRLLLFDPRQSGKLQPFSGLAHLIEPVVTGPEETRAAVLRLMGLLLWRSRIAPAELERQPSLVVVIDELYDVLAQGREVRDALSFVASRGRGVKLHLICETQFPSHEYVSSMVKANMPFRLVGRTASANDAVVAAGAGRTGAHLLHGKGEFVTQWAGDPVRIQAALCEDETIKALVKASRDYPVPPFVPWQEFGEEPEDDGDGGEVEANLRAWWERVQGTPEAGQITKAFRAAYDAAPGGEDYQRRKGKVEEILKRIREEAAQQG